MFEFPFDILRVLIMFWHYSAQHVVTCLLSRCLALTMHRSISLPIVQVLDLWKPV